MILAMDKNYLFLVANLKIVVHQTRKNNKEIITNLKGTRMVKDGEDSVTGLQMTNLKNLNLTNLKIQKPCSSSFKRFL